MPARFVRQALICWASPWQAVSSLGNKYEPQDNTSADCAQGVNAQAKDCDGKQNPVQK